jgi:hypothetical protein
MSAGLENAVNLATALQAYAVKKTTDTTSNTDVLIQKSNLRKTSFDRLFPAMFSLHGLDIKMALDRAVKDGDITTKAEQVAIRAINAAMSDISDRYPVLTQTTFSEITNIVNDFILAFNEGGTDSIRPDKVKLMDTHMERLKNKFKQPYIVTYFAGDETRVASLKVAHNSFSNLRDIINKKIKDQVSLDLANNRITNSKLKDSAYLTTKIINWGHTQADNSIITGKLLAELLSAKNMISGVSNKNEIISIISKDFLQQTGQEKTVIKLHQGELTKGDPNVLRLVIESGIFQTVVVQNRRENQEDLGQLEKKWNILDALARNNLLKVFEVTSTTQLVNKLLKVRSSPSILEKLENTLVETILGKKVKTRTSKVIPLLNTTVKKVKRKRQVTLKNNISKDGLRLDTRPTIPSAIELTSLMNLINQQLQDVVSANMGDGGSRSVLNYRTGRLASSAKVEYMSESRAGMITAFYSYMKNPYATFSDGGKQSSPRSRDPKLLISKSIREIAAAQVGNRLRAVNI